MLKISSSNESTPNASPLTSENDSGSDTSESQSDNLQQTAQPKMFETQIVESGTGIQTIIKTENDMRHPLESKWILWYHGNSSWQDEKLVQISTLETIEDFWKNLTLIKSYYLQNAWFFIMKEGVIPSWEVNPDGGGWSYRVSKKDVLRSWNELAVYLVSENLVPGLMDELIGISISPKKTFSIIKLWIRDDKKKDSIKLNHRVRNFRLEDSIYRSHHDNLLKENES